MAVLSWVSVYVCETVTSHAIMMMMMMMMMVIIIIITIIIIVVVVVVKELGLCAFMP